jgi:hypothetical protein
MPDAANEIVAGTQRKRHAYLGTRRLGTVELYWTVCLHPLKSRKPPKPEEHAVSEQNWHILGDGSGNLAWAVRPSPLSSTFRILSPHLTQSCRTVL